MKLLWRTKGLKIQLWISELSRDRGTWLNENLHCKGKELCYIWHTNILSFTGWRVSIAGLKWCIMCLYSWFTPVCVWMEWGGCMESVLSIYQTKRFHCCCRDQVGGSQLTADGEGDIKHSPFHLAQTCKPCLTLLEYLPDIRLFIHRRHMAVLVIANIH